MFNQMTPTLFSSTNDFLLTVWNREFSPVFRSSWNHLFYGHLRCYNENATTEIYQICDFNCWKDFSFVAIDFWAVPYPKRLCQ